MSSHPALVVRPARIVAIHEAAHALGFLLAGCTLEWTTIVPSARCRSVRGSVGVWFGSPRTLEELFLLLRAFCAGPAAQAIAEGKPLERAYDYFYGKDYRAARRLIDEFRALRMELPAARKRQADVYLRAVFRHTWHLYHRAHFQRAVGRIAAQLLEHKTLSRKQVQRAAKCSRWDPCVPDLEPTGSAP